MIREIIAEQILGFFKLGPTDRPPSISIVIETDTSTVIPTLGQILIRKATPELFLQAAGILGTIKKVTYKLTTSEYIETEINPRTAELFIQDCMEKVENNPKIAHMREQDTSLEAKGKCLREKFGRFFR